MVLSLTLPGPDGFKVLDAIQKEKSISYIPVITTARPDAGMESRALDMGADDFMCKPYLMDSLLKRIQRATGLASSQKKIKLFQSTAYVDHLTG